ncbi:MAG: glycosyltransferase [Verrucomicrobiota bacterium]
MILVTVGSDLPFDRMVKVIDEWAGETGRDDVFAQIGDTDWVPKHIRHARFLEPAEFSKRFKEADRVIAHAGMGSILSALCAGKPILVMPRRAALRETRNDHQVATAKHIRSLGKVETAFDEAELRSCLERIDFLETPSTVGRYASEGLVSAIRNLVMEPRDRVRG